MLCAFLCMMLCMQGHVDEPKLYILTLKFLFFGMQAILHIFSSLLWCDRAESSAGNDFL